MQKPFLFVNFDFDKIHEVVEMAEFLHREEKDENWGMKINLNSMIEKVFSYTSNGLKNLIKFTDRAFFIDMKMWDNLSTTKKIIEMFSDVPNIKYTNIRLLAGNKILETAVKAAEKGKINLLGITVLSHNEDYCREHFRRSLSETVEWLTKKAINFGFKGVILPGKALESVKNESILKVVPGINLAQYIAENNFQELIITPEYAIQNGADILICGSSITKSRNPVGSLKDILRTVNTVNEKSL